MQNKLENVLQEIQKAILGKQDVVKKVLMAILADGHILLDDVPGVGKTTLAVSLGKALGLEYRRVQCTPDVLPSDIVGFSIYNQSNGSFQYMPGVINKTNLLLADEINRTSSKTQSALLEAMEEHQISVDGSVYQLEKPFIVIATENHVGTAGTQLLPHAQLDRFLVRLTIGYPDFDAQMDMLKSHALKRPVDAVENVLSREDIIRMQSETAQVTIKDEILDYITRLTVASRDLEEIELGISPRGAIAVSRMARACAYLNGRDYVVPEDVKAVFSDVCAHRILLNRQAKTKHLTAEQVLGKLLNDVPAPFESK